MARAAATGVVGAALLALGSAAALALSLPLLGSADEAAHVDHAVAVWQGRLPAFEDGVGFTAGVELPPGRSVPPVQWTAQHPPLYYLLAAPLAGPAAADGDWRAAVLGARAVSVLLVPLSVLAAALAAAAATSSPAAGSRRPARAALAVAALAATLPAHLHYGALAHNDLLAVVATSALVATGCLALSRGLRAPTVVAACVAGAVGMSTRAPVAVALAVTCAAFAVAGGVHGQGPVGRRVGRGLLAAAAVGACAVLAAGWFYLRNRLTTGRWTGGSPQWALEVLGRRRWDLGEVLTEPAFWTGSADWYLAGRDGVAVVAIGLPVLLVAAALAAGVAGALRRLRTPSTRSPRAGVPVLVPALLAAHVLGVVALQAHYVTGGGGVSERYTLVLLAPVLVALAAGPLALPGAGMRLVVVVAALGWASGLPRLDLRATLSRGATVDGVPAGVVVATLVLALVGAVLLVAAAWALDRSRGRGTEEQSASASGEAPTGLP